jgi:hypothetical protein
MSTRNLSVPLKNSSLVLMHNIIVVGKHQRSISLIMAAGQNRIADTEGPYGNLFPLDSLPSGYSHKQSSLVGS